MEEGVATSYTEALSIAKSEVEREKDKIEKISREEAFNNEQRKINQEILASQKRTEQYAKDQAYYAKRQAEYAEDQNRILERDAKDAEKYRKKSLKQGEKALQESRDRYDEFKRNN